MKRKNWFTAILVAVLLLTSMFYLAQSENRQTNTAEEIIPKVITLRDDQKAAAIVNGVEIPLKEYERLQINAGIQYRAQLSYYLEQKYAGKIDPKEYEARVAALDQFHNDPARNQKLLNTLIKDEVLYQEARAKGYRVTVEEARAYEAKAPEMLSAEQLEFLTQYAKSMSMTYAEYVEAYSVPIRQRKMTSALLLTEYKDASLEEYQQLIASLFEKSEIQVQVETK